MPLNAVTERVFVQLDLIRNPNKKADRRSSLWKELRKMGFRNEVFTTLEMVVDRLCDTILKLTKDVDIVSAPQAGSPNPSRASGITTGPAGT